MHPQNKIRLSRRGAIAAAIVLALNVRAYAGEKGSAMTLTFGTREVTVSGVVGRHRVIAFGIGLGTFSNSPLLTRTATTASDDDGDGKVVINDSSLQADSVWIAVDSETGDYVVATPSGQTPRVLDVPADSWRGNRADLDVHRSYLEALVVRPKVGAWTLRMSDGGSNDADGKSNGTLKLRLDRMQKLAGEAKGPPFVVAKDLVVLIDPHTLDTFVDEAR